MSLQYEFENPEREGLEAVEQKLVAIDGKFFEDGAIGKMEISYPSRKRARESIQVRLVTLYEFEFEDEGKTINNLLDEVQQFMAVQKENTTFTVRAATNTKHDPVLYERILMSIYKCFKSTLDSAAADKSEDYATAAMQLCNAMYQLGVLEGHFYVPAYVRRNTHNRATTAGKKMTKARSILKDRAVQIGQEEHYRSMTQREAAKKILPLIVKETKNWLLQPSKNWKKPKQKM